MKGKIIIKLFKIESPIHHTPRGFRLIAEQCNGRRLTWRGDYNSEILAVRHLKQFADQLSKPPFSAQKIMFIHPGLGEFTVMEGKE